MPIKIFIKIKGGKFMSIMEGIQINEFGELVISKDLQEEIITFLTENDIETDSLERESGIFDHCTTNNCRCTVKK
jgi:hypothetical protein